MSVALDNARLLDETRRLLAETDQSAAELATVNAVSQALVSELDLDALIEMTGEQVRQTLAADIVYVALLVRQTNTIHFRYTYGETLSAIALGEGLTSRIIATREPLLINEDIEARQAGLEIQPVGAQAKSYLVVPIIASVPGDACPGTEAPPGLSTSGWPPKTKRSTGLRISPP